MPSAGRPDSTQRFSEWGPRASVVWVAPEASGSWATLQRVRTHAQSEAWLSWGRSSAPREDRQRHTLHTWALAQCATGTGSWAPAALRWLVSPGAAQTAPVPATHPYTTGGRWTDVAASPVLSHTHLPL